MRLYVTSVTIPAGETMGRGTGINDDGLRVTFVGDHGPMRYLFEALETGEEVIVDVPGYAISKIEDLT